MRRTAQTQLTFLLTLNLPLGVSTAEMIEFIKSALAEARANHWTDRLPTDKLAHFDPATISLKLASRHVIYPKE